MPTAIVDPSTSIPDPVAQIFSHSWGKICVSITRERYLIGTLAARARGRIAGIGRLDEARVRRLSHCGRSPRCWRRATCTLSLLMRGDGNLVIYRATDGRALWSSRTGGSPDASLVMRDDGDVVIHARDGRLLWRSAIAGNYSAFAELRDDGLLHVCGFDRGFLWSRDHSHLDAASG